MKHLIIYAHPDPSSLNNQLKNTLIEHLLNNGEEVELRDLYQLNFNPVLSLKDAEGQRKGKVANDVEKEQEFISWADSITFVYPIWWTGLPAIMKGYIDRVFSYGFAYQYQNGIQQGLLAGKQAIIINTHGKSKTEYAETGMDEALSLTSDKGIYAYCGLEIKMHLFFDNADRTTAEIIEKWKLEIREPFNKKIMNNFEVNDLQKIDK
ncbi:NAD(P)H dehydrogenase (quinone) [Pedobacter sp. UYP30]|uniref:NAD(P)H-dependent oxidoreductase n=1 Tax=Pedobacter sp. UYP30 TaxID=1756400 RepID=UPI00339091BA